MERLSDAFLPLVVWLVFVCLIGFFILMYRLARKQKGAAMAFGMLIQMFLPDPKVQQTIECVSESKQQEQDKSGASDSLPDGSDEDDKL